jgi:hypothetical protein
LRHNEENKKDKLFTLMTAQHDGLLSDESNERLAVLLSGDEEAQCYYIQLGKLLQELEEKLSEEWPMPDSVRPDKRKEKNEVENDNAINCDGGCGARRSAKTECGADCM